MAQLISLPLTVSCFSKIQIGFTFLVPAHPGSPGQRAVKRVCVCVCAEVSGKPVRESLRWACTYTQTNKLVKHMWMCGTALCWLHLTTSNDDDDDNDDDGRNYNKQTMMILAKWAPMSA